MASFYLNSYIPLVATKAGRIASETFNLPPFVDGSIRREPDLQHPFPAISCLCRGDRFAPRLVEDDVVGYMVRKGGYGTRRPQRRLTAVLRVLQIYPTHDEGARWYRERDLPLPNNCCVPGNAAKPLEHSHRYNKRFKHLSALEMFRMWDGSYRKRARQYGTYVICEPLFVDLQWSAPEPTEDILVEVFGVVPGTLNPGRQSIAHGQRLLSKLGIDVSLTAT